MQTGNIKIRINVVRSRRRARATTCQLWTNTAQGLACIWDTDKYV